MLSGILIYTTDPVWEKIVTDLSATVTTDIKTADINIDSMDITLPVSSLDLAAQILNIIDQKQQKIISEIFGAAVTLPQLQRKIVVLLYRCGGMSAGQLKDVLGIAPDVATHTIDTAIYQLRKMYGKDFIKNENGKYSIGKL